MRAAASSRASGRPSRRAQIAATAWALSGVSVKARLDCPSAVHEQGDRGDLAQLGQWRQTAQVRHRQWAQRQLVLPAHPQRLAAGDQHLEARARRQELGDVRRGRHDLLEVVEHHQQLAAAQGLREAFEQRALAKLADAD